jgi:hypothetical protein
MSDWNYSIFNNPQTNRNEFSRLKTPVDSYPLFNSVLPKRMERYNARIKEINPEEKQMYSRFTKLVNGSAEKQELNDKIEKLTREKQKLVLENEKNRKTLSNIKRAKHYDWYNLFDSDPDQKPISDGNRVLFNDLDGGTKKRRKKSNKKKSNKKKSNKKKSNKKKRNNRTYRR